MQGTPRSQPPWQREHLWLTLQALGFEAGASTAGRTLAHVTFGVNMFDKPNKDAFCIVFHFLFTKLDGARSKDTFRYCWPPLDKKKDAEFRKATCEWLKKISDEVGNSFPQVVASLFLSPGGPKFVQLLYHFAKYVMSQHVKRDVAAENSYVPDALQCRPQDPQKALARNKIACNRYLQTLQRENFVITEYQKKAQSLVKQIRTLRSEFAALQTQSRAIQSVQSDTSGRNTNLEEVRSMWSKIMQTFNALHKEMEVVDFVVTGDVDQFFLDGSNVTLNIPNILVTKIESEMYKLQLENVYEAGKVNLITVIQLLNEALKMVKQENVYRNRTEFHVDVQYLSSKVKFETEMLERIKRMRQKIKREDIVCINKSIADKERDWEKKWMRILGTSPFSLFKGLNPVLELQSPLAPLSFEPATDDALRNSVFSQYLVSLPELPISDSGVKHKAISDSLSFTDGTLSTPTGRKTLPFKKSLSMRRLSLNEKEFRTPTSNGKENFLQRSALQKRRSDTSWSTPTSSSLHCTPTQSQPDARSAARLQLAQQVADYIVNDSPKFVPNRGMELEDLIGMLSSNPFLSTKEIPRTPENLISDIRTSWREAIQTEEISGVSSPLQSPCRESPAEPEPAHCSQIDLSMACFLSTSLLSEQNDSPEPQVPSFLKPSSFQERALSRSTLQSPTNEKNELQPEKGNSLQESENARTSSPFVEKNRTNMLQSFLQPEDISVQTTLSWNSSKIPDYNNSSDSHEVIQFGILHETLPEGAGNISLNSTTSLETPEAKKNMSRGDQLLQNPDYSCKSVDRKLDINSIRTRYEALKRTFYIDDETGKDQTPLRRICKQKSESCLRTDFGNVCSPLEEGLSLEYLMTPLPKGRKLSLPQLISFSPDDGVHGRRSEELADVFDSQGAGSLTEALDLSQPALNLQKCTDEGTGQLITL